MIYMKAKGLRFSQSFNFIMFLLFNDRYPVSFLYILSILRKLTPKSLSDSLGSIQFS